MNRTNLYHLQVNFVWSSQSGLGCGRFDTGLEALAQLLELGRDARDAIGVPLAFVRPIVLVIVLGGPPLALGFDRGDDAVAVIRVVPGDCLARLAVLLVVLRKDRRAILRPDVVALPVELGRIVSREKDIEQVLVTELLGIE